ncbi:MAG: hypothetical protein KME12_11505 [Trichocoleus desertorum ATA4-8-CV12]|nr:hypothetical protein [Trichocoleus desertorum ATA4-8-CV12]
MIKSQLYFDDVITDQVYAQPPYASQGERFTRNERDGIFGDGGEQLMLQLSKAALAKEAQGYVGRFELGLQVA